jgi:hypothetical protein
MIGDDGLVRLRGLHGQDECNCRGVSYKPRWGVVRVPAEDVGPLIHVGGFHLAHEADASAEHSTLEDVQAAAWSLPLGTARSTLLAILQSPNSLAHLCQSISFN